MTAPSPYSLTTVKIIQLEKVTVFLNTLSGNDKYFLLSRDNLMQPIQMHLSQKQKALSQFFCAFFKFRSNFEHFQKEDDLDRLCIS